MRVMQNMFDEVPEMLCTSAGPCSSWQNRYRVFKTHVVELDARVEISVIEVAYVDVVLIRGLFNLIHVPWQCLPYAGLEMQQFPVRNL